MKRKKYKLKEEVKEKLQLAGAILIAIIGIILCIITLGINKERAIKDCINGGHSEYFCMKHL